ncbi:MAG TPA: MFS transporter, partial [Micromonosporaceae bacterium]
AISTVGDYMFDTTLVVWVASVLLRNSRWGPAAVSGLMLCVLLAVIVVGPAAGVFIDRWSRRTTMMRSEIIRGIAVGVLTVLTLLPRHTLPTWAWIALLYLVVFGVNATGQFFNPARFATIGDIVPGEADRARAFAIGQGTTAGAAIVGPPLAAPLLFAVGIQWALLINVLSYGVSYVAIRSVRFPASDTSAETLPHARWRTEFAAGLRMFAGNRFLVALLTIAVIAQLGTGALNALDIYFVTDNLHVNPHLYGVMAMAFGLGSIAGAMLAGRVVKAINARNTTWIGMLIAGIMIVVYARQTSFATGLIGYFLIALPLTVLNSGVSPLLLAATPKEFLGRMSAVFNPVSMAASTISVVLSGALASSAMRDFHATVVGVHVGRIDTIFTVSGLLIVAAGIYGALRLPPSPSGADEKAVVIPAQADPLEPSLDIAPTVPS